MRKITQNVAQSQTSPKGGRQGCLCSNGTYSIKCCTGGLQAQGIGNITGQIVVLVSANRITEISVQRITENNDNRVTQ